LRFFQIVPAHDIVSASRARNLAEDVVPGGHLTTGVANRRVECRNVLCGIACARELRGKL
jgi:hypothetical protein